MLRYTYLFKFRVTFLWSIFPIFSTPILITGGSWWLISIYYDILRLGGLFPPSPPSGYTPLRAHTSFYRQFGTLRSPWSSKAFFYRYIVLLFCLLFGASCLLLILIFCHRTFFSVFCFLARIEKRVNDLKLRDQNNVDILRKNSLNCITKLESHQPFQRLFTSSDCFILSHIWIVRLEFLKNHPLRPFSFKTTLSLTNFWGFLRRQGLVWVWGEGGGFS